jgi:hypothetical protein
MGQGRGDSKVMHRTARIAVWVAVAGAGLLTAYARLVRPLQVGDLIPMVAGKDVGVRVKELEPGRRML